MLAVHTIAYFYNMNEKVGKVVSFLGIYGCFSSVKHYVSQKMSSS